MTEQQLTEDFGLFFEHLGVPRMAGRILAWLLICDPPEQTMQDLVDALGASKSSISTMTRMLINFRLIERLSLPGERRDFYRVRPDLWRRSLDDAQRKFEASARWPSADSTCSKANRQNDGRECRRCTMCTIF